MYVTSQSQFGSNFEFNDSLNDSRAVSRFLVSEERADLLDLLFGVSSASEVEVISSLLEVDDTDADEPSENVFNGLFETCVKLGDLAFFMELGNDLVELLNNSVTLENKVVVADGLDGQQGDSAGVEQVATHLHKEVGDRRSLMGLGYRHDHVVGELDVSLLFEEVDSLIDELARNVSFFH
jgi:hypothetical protein